MLYQKSSVFINTLPGLRFSYCFLFRSFDRILFVKEFGSVRLD